MKKISYFFFLLTLIFTPLAFGTVEPWSILSMEILIGLAVLAYGLQSVGTPVKLLHVPGLIPLLLLVGWMLLQMLPLPVFLVKLLSPAAYHVYKPVYDLLPGDSWMPLSVYRKGTALECLRMVSSILFYILTIQILRQAETLKQTVKICCWLGIGIALVAIMQRFSSPDSIFWFRPAPLNSFPMGPWINRSQYCGFAEMLAPLVLALMLYYRPAAGAKNTLRSRIVAFFTVPGGNLYIILGGGVLILVTSIFVSLSRGGILAVSLSLPMVFLLLAWKKSRFSHFFIISITAMLIITVGWFGWGPILERFDETFGKSGILNIDRFHIWRDSWQIVKDFWLTGSGFGTFVNIFPEYKTIPGNLSYYHAHNDYLELLTDGGLVSFTLVVCFFASLLRESWTMIGRRRDRYSLLIGIGSLTGISAMLVHGLSDFNMHNGADALYFFFFCGLLVSALHTRLRFHTAPTLLPDMPWLSGRSLSVLALVFLGAVILLQGGGMLAMWKYQEIQSVYLSRQLDQKQLEKVALRLHESAVLDPLSGMYPFLQGDAERYLQHPDRSLALSLQAAKNNPTEGAFLQRIALDLPDDQQAAAEILMEKGGQRTLRKDDLMLTQAEWLLRTGRRAKAIETLRGGLGQNSRLVTVVVSLLQQYSFSREETAAVLPPSMGAWVAYGSFMEKMGDYEDARYYYSHALDYGDGETPYQADWFSVLYAYYRAQNEENKALEVLRLGIAKCPDYAMFHVWLGDFYVREGVFYRAREEYQQASLLAPGNQQIRGLVEKMAAIRQE